jgi:hypothetical protein
MHGTKTGIEGVSKTVASHSFRNDLEGGSGFSQHCAGWFENRNTGVFICK